MNSSWRCIPTIVTWRRGFTNWRISRIGSRLNIEFVDRMERSRWLSGGGQVVARSPDGKAQRLVNVVADVTDRKVAEEHVKFLMGELTHRSKNLLSVVQAIASQTGRTVDTFEEFQKRFAQRLQGLAASHDLLVLQDWQGASLTDLVRDQLAPFTEPGSERVTVSGPDVIAKTRGRGGDRTCAARTGDQRGEIWRVISSGWPCYDFLGV